MEGVTKEENEDAKHQQNTRKIFSSGLSIILTNNLRCSGFKDLRSLVMISINFWGVTQCSLIQIYINCLGTYCLYAEGRRAGQGTSKKQMISLPNASLVLLVWLTFDADSGSSKSL